MTKIRLPLAAALLAIATLASAQGPTPAASSPAKKELIQKILQIQSPAIEALARRMVEAPALMLLQQAGPVLQQKVAADKREAVAKDIQDDVRKFVDETAPVVKERAAKLAPSTIGPLLEEKFSEDELKQVVAMLESPVYKKFFSMGGDMERVLREKLVTETRGTVEPKMQALQASMAKRLGVSPAAPAGAASGAKKK